MRKIAVRGRTLGDGPNVDPQVHSRARLRMDVQSSTCVVLPRCLGKPNRYGPKVLDAMLLKIGHSQLMHELLVTLMAEVTGIVNSHPIATIPSDTDEPQPLTPAMLLTMKTWPLAPTPGQFVRQDLYMQNWWRKAQYLDDQFWVRWRKEYLQNLQKRPK